MPPNPIILKSQICITFTLNIQLVIKLSIYFIFFQLKECSQSILLYLMLIYILQFIHITANKCCLMAKIPILIFLSALMLLAGIGTLIGFTIGSFSLPDHCNQSAKTLIPISQILFSYTCVIIPIFSTCIHVKDAWTMPDIDMQKSLNLLSVRVCYHALNQIILFMIVTAFLNQEPKWGTGLLLFLVIPTFVQIIFILKANQNKLTGTQINLGKGIQVENPDLCTCLAISVVMLLVPIWYFIVGQVGLFELWFITHRNKLQYFFINIALLMKVIFLAVPGLLYAILARENQKISMILFYAFVGYWLFTTLMIVYPFLFVAYKFGCNRNRIFSVCNMTLFARQEVKQYMDGIKEIE